MLPTSETDWRKSRTLALLQEYKANPTIATRNRIVELNVGLARKVALEYARRYAERCPFTHEELTNEAVNGLIKAIEYFELDRGNAFSSYAMPFVRGAILHYLRDNWAGLKLPRKWREHYEQVQRICRQMQKKGRTITEEEAAAAIDITPLQWREIEEANQRKPLVNLDELHSLPLEQEEHDEQRERLKEKLPTELAFLPGVAYDCVMGRYYYGLDDAAIAKQHRLNVVRVQQLIDEALQTMRTRLEMESA